MAHWNESFWFSLALSAAFKSTMVLGAAGFVAWLLRGRSAAARHVVWTAAAIAILALPLLIAALPELPLSGAGAVLDSGRWMVTTTATTRNGAAIASDPVTAATLPAHPATPVTAIHPADWRFNFLLVWAIGALIAVLQMAVAGCAMYCARRRSFRFADDDLVARLSHSLQLDRNVEVLEDPRTSMPMAFGLFRPSVYLPEGAVDWPEERLRLVLLHELAHIRRGDTVTHWIARFALSLNWWNPAAWMAWRAFLKERERATDDLVLEAGARASEYASQLLEVARTMQPRPALGCAAIAMARRSQLEGRLLAILDPAVRRRAPRRIATVAAAVAAIVLVAPLAAIHAQDQSNAVPIDLDATIRAANAQKNHEILDRAAKAALSQGQLEIARKLLDASVQIREEVSGPQSVDYGVGLTKLGDLAQREGKSEDALTYYKGAVAAIGNRPEAAQALINIGIQTFRKDTEGAIGYFQQAESIDPEHAQLAVTWMGIVRAKHPETIGEAESLYQRAIAMGKPDSSDTAVAMDLYGFLLKQAGRTDEAEQLHQQAQQIRDSKRPPTVATAAIPNAFRVGNGVTAPVPVFKPEPEYTEMARLAKYQGEVTVSVIILEDGRPTNIKVVHSLGMGLDEKAIDTVSQWRFKPGTKNGVPVAVQAAISVNFRLL